jgi:hypothetical protein
VRAIEARTGATNVTLTVSDALGRSAAATATLEVTPATVPGTGSGTVPPDPGNAGTASNSGKGGGGSFDFFALFCLIALATSCGAGRRFARLTTWKSFL